MKRTLLGIGFVCGIAGVLLWFQRTNQTVDTTQHEPTLATNGDNGQPSSDGDLSANIPQDSRPVAASPRATATPPPTPPDSASPQSNSPPVPDSGKAAANTKPAGELKAIGSTVIQGLGPVKILDRKREVTPDGHEAQVLLVEHAAGKYPYLRVVQRDAPEVSVAEISVADHVLVQFAGGVEDLAIEQALAENGLTIRKKFIHPGLYSVAVDTPSIDAATDMIADLKALGATVETAEPDYLVFPN